MSWAPDGGALLIGRAAGLTGDEQKFGILDMEKRKVIWLHVRHLRGLAYR
jgi:hypothetical protein